MTQSQKWVVVQVVSAYWIVSISMVYLNKVLLSDGGASLKAPLFITLFQSIVSCGICWILGMYGEVNRSAKVESFTTEWTLISSVKSSTALAVLPLSLIFVGMVGFNNLCLQFVEVSFYNVARCLSLVFNVTLSYFVLGKSTSWNVCLTLLLVIAGFTLGIDGEINFSFIGTLYGVTSSLFVSLSSIYTAKVLPLVSNDKSQLIFYNNFNAVWLLVPLIAFFESRYILEHFDKMLSPTFWFCMVLASIMGFSVALVTVLQIKFTSPLTHNISGTAKAAVQSILAYYIWKNPASEIGLLGLGLVLIGSALYTILVMRESNQQALSTARPALVGDGKSDEDEENDNKKQPLLFSTTKP